MTARQVPGPSEVDTLPPARGGPDVRVREYKQVALPGGTAIVSIPHAGFGGLMFTDHVLEHHRMDQVAVLDCSAFPPVAMVHAGKPRFPLRIHADIARRLAVVRAEFIPSPYLARPIADALLDWALRSGVAQVVAVDTSLVAIDIEPPDGDLQRPGSLLFVANAPGLRKAAAAAGLLELEHGIVPGVTGVLLTEGRLRGVEVVALLAPVNEPLDEARSALAFARMVPRLVDGLRVDPKALEAALERTDRMIRALRDQVEQAASQMRKAVSPPMMYG